jgi:hypothetical protein
MDSNACPECGGRSEIVDAEEAWRRYPALAEQRYGEGGQMAVCLSECGRVAPYVVAQVSTFDDLFGGH